MKKKFKMNKLFPAPIHSLVPSSAASSKKYKKSKIPRALREQVWIQKAGRVFDKKCAVSWCENLINAFNFQAGHNIPESRGGKTNIENLVPICDRCNFSMGAQYSIDEWSGMGSATASSPPKPEQPQVKKPWWLCFF
jgi:hypothetical protein